MWAYSISNLVSNNVYWFQFKREGKPWRISLTQTKKWRIYLKKYSTTPASWESR